MAISYVAAGAGAAQTATVVPPLPAGIVADDLLILIIEAAGQASSISNPAGGTWTSTPSGAQLTGTAGGVSSAGIEVYWSKFNGTQTAPTLGDAGDHTAARIYAFRGVHTTTPIHTTAGAVAASATTALSAPSVTTSVADAWVLVCATLMDDAQDFGATWTNTNLAGITVRNASYGHTLGNDGRLILVTGTKVAAGVVGATTNTLTAASTQALITVALQPAPVAGGAVTLTVPTAKPQAVPLTPQGQPGAATLTLGPFRTVAVALEPAAVAGTTLLVPTIRAVASPVDPIGTGPGAGVITPATLRTDAVPIIPTPGATAVTLTPAVLRTQPGVAQPVAAITETFNKADGALGPNLTWTPRVFLPATGIQVASNQARFQTVAPASEVDISDLQVPAPNVTGDDHQIQFTVTATTPGTGNFFININTFVRFALYAANTDFRGYGITVARTDLIGFPVDAYALFISRFDASTEYTVFPGSGMLAAAVTLPATVTVTVRGNQIFARMEHAGTGPTLYAAVTDNTYPTGTVALGARLNAQIGQTVSVTIDNWTAGPAPPGPETTTLTPAALTLEPGLVLQHVQDIVDAGDLEIPPDDIYDGGDLATPPVDVVDPEYAFVDLNPAELRVFIPIVGGLTPIGVGGSTTTLTPATLKALPVPVAPASSGTNEISPVTLKTVAVPLASVVPGVVTTTITPANAVAAAVAVSPATLPGAVTLTPAVAELQTGTTAPAGSGAMSIPPATMRAVAVPVSPVGVGPSSVTATPVTARFIPVAPASVVPGLVTTTATPATARLAAVAVTPQAPAATTLTPATLRIQAVAFIWVTVDLDIVIGPTRLRAATTTNPTRGTGLEAAVAVTRLPHEIEVTRNRAATTTSVTRDRSRTTLSPTRPRAQTATSGTTRQGIGVGATRDGQEP